MSTRGSFRRGRFGTARLALAGLLVVIGLLWGVTSALAVHDNGMFELDGNTAHNSATTPPYDWNSLFDASGNRILTPDPVTGPILADIFVKDTAEPDQTYFASNKDINPIASGAQHWGCGPANNPLDKDNILNTYAALIQVPANAPDNAGHQVLYLASERGSNNGTSFAGFWLLKDKTVGCSGSNNFSGQHTDGDLLVVSDYTNGGGQQDVTVYRWTGDDATGQPVQIAALNGSVCGAAAGPDDACAIANSGVITTPWSPTSHDSNTFVEAGIDLTNLLGANGGCFTNFLAETRSSNQLTATLKDFAGGQFNTCVPPPISTTATPGGSVNPPGVATQHDVANISTVGNRPAPTGTISFFLCNPSQVTAAGCPSGGTPVGGAPIVGGSATSANAGAALTATAGKYCWRAEYTPDAAGSNFYVASSHTDAVAECFTVIHGSPTIPTQIAVTGKNAPSLGFTTLGDTATLTGFVANTDGETITFKLYGPFGANVQPDCTGNPVFTTTGTLTNGKATTAQTFTPTAAGTYVWVASYPGDQFNDPITGKCTDANESATILAPSLSVTKTADANTVSAGDPIGFKITVANAGPGTANGVTLKDPLPAGTTVAGWTLDSTTIAAPGSCTINAVPAGQELDCTAVDLASGASYDVHISAATDFADCTLYDNTATASASNSPDKTGHDSIQCLKPALSVTKTADASPVSAGDPIGFKITVANAGPGTAEGVTLKDPLPAGTTATGWKLDSSTIAAPGSCTINAVPAGQELDCTAVDLASGASYDVHISAKTNFLNCTLYDNTATASATNSPNKTGHDSIQCLKPSLTVTKKADASPVDAGDPIGFTITVANGGPGTAKGVTLADPLPGGTVAGWSIDNTTIPAPGGCTMNAVPAGQELDCTAVDLGSGASYTVHISAKTDFRNCIKYTNTATASASNAPDATGTDSIQCQKPSLTVTKTADAAIVNAGDPLGFKIAVANGGPGTAKGVTLADPLPGGTTAAGWSIDSSSIPVPGSCTINAVPAGQELDCTAVDLGPGDSYDVHISAKTDFQHCTTYDNTATASSSNAPNAIGSDSISCLAPGLNVVKKADAKTVDAGDPLGFTITVGNGGPGTAFVVNLADPLPGGTTAAGWILDSNSNPAVATCAIVVPVGGGQELDCSSAFLLAGQSYTLHISAKTNFQNCAKYDNTATATALNAPPASASDSIQCLKPSLTVTKKADAGTVDAGDPLGFKITVANGGPGTAKGVTLADPLPGGTVAGWKIDTTTIPNPGNCTINAVPAGQELDCTAVDLGPGDSYDVHISAKTNFQNCTKYDNTATASSSNAPDAPGTDSIQCLKPDLTLVKTADAATVDAGDPLGFKITVANGGPGTAKGVTLADPLPKGATVGGWNLDSSTIPAPGSCSITGAIGNQELDCTAVDLGSGASYDVHISAATDFLNCVKYDNTATASASNAPDAIGSDSIQCNKPSLTVTKTADAGTVNAGDPLGFTITVANGGPGTAKAVTLADPLPGGTTAGWTIDNSTIPNPGSCTINAVPAGQELDCTAVDLGSGASYDVHISAGTDAQNCTTYDNTATASSSNAPDATGHDNITCLKPGLNVIKKADANTVDAGDPIGFTITVGNGGPGTAKAVTLKDPLPGGTTAAGWTIDNSTIPAPGSCTINAVPAGQELDCTAVDLGVNASYDVHISAKTDFQNCIKYDNTATASASNAPDATGTDSIQCNAPSLTVTKTADNATVDAGDPIGFKITVANGGPGTAKGVTLADPLPAGTTAAGWTLDSTTIPAPGACTINAVPAGRELDCTAVDLGSGASYDVHVSAATDFQNCTKYDNTATASSSNAPDANGSDSVQCNKGLVSITKKADHSAPVNAGSQIGFTVEVKNTGAGAVGGVKLADALPAGTGSGVTWAIDPAVGTPAQFVLAGAQGAQTLSLASGSLPAGADYTVHVTAATSQAECGVYDNTATLTTRNANDPNPASASESCAFHVDLSVTKAGSPAEQDLGQGNITWTMVITNNGPDTDTGVTIADPMPSGNTFVSATTTQGTCTGGAILNCNIGTMAAGATVTITLVTTPSIAGQQVNTVTVVGDRPETNTLNNQASAHVAVDAITPPAPVYCVAVSKITPKQLFVGRKTALTIRLTKHGEPAAGVRVLIKGPKLHVTTKRSNARGVIKQVVKMKKAGIDTFIPLASKHCNTKRVGVTGVFTPPVTG